MATRGGQAAQPPADATTTERVVEQPQDQRHDQGQVDRRLDEGEAKFRAYLTQRADSIQKFIRDKSSMTPLALVSAAVMAFRREPDKLKDEKSWRSMVTALVVAAQFDLEPIGREGWLVPRWQKRGNFHEWSFMPSYQGLVKQALLSGLVKSIRSHVVYEKEHCVIQLGDSPGVDHRPIFGERGEPIGVYAVARMTDGSIEIEPMPWSEVEKIRRAAQDSSPAWAAWPEEMARKCPLKRLTKQLPAGASFAALVQLDNALESGRDDDRQAAIEVALRDKIALLPEAQRSFVEDAFARAPGQSKAAGDFASKVKRLDADKYKADSEAKFAAAAVRNHEGATVSRLTDDEANSPPPNVACDECSRDVRAGGLDIDPKWDVLDHRAICSACQGINPTDNPQ